MSMDNSGNVVWVDNHDIRATNVRAAGKGVDLEDGESMNIQQKGAPTCVERFRSICILSSWLPLHER